MGSKENERCIDGSRYVFVPDNVTMIGDPGTGDASERMAYYLEQIATMLAPIYEHYASWYGEIISSEITVPANSQRRRYSLSPAARTIRIECDSVATIWLNEDRGVPIPIGGDRRVLYLSDLPPKAAIHDIYVTTVEEMHMNLLAVS
jgi:hypothetical protein